MVGPGRPPHPGLPAGARFSVLDTRFAGLAKDYRSHEPGADVLRGEQPSAQADSGGRRGDVGASPHRRLPGSPAGGQRSSAQSRVVSSR